MPSHQVPPLCSDSITRGRVSRAGRFLLLAVCLAAFTVGTTAPFLWPQRPDGDMTARAEFRALEGTHPVAARLGLLDVRHAFWYNAAGAVLAVWALDALLVTPLRPHSLGKMTLWAGALLWLAGWGWTQRFGWRGDLFLAPGQAVSVGTWTSKEIGFLDFITPPAPAGPGRALRARLLVDGEPVVVDVAHPYRRGGWTIEPRWYGGIVRLPGASPLYFGADGTRTVSLPDGRRVTVTLDVESLAVHTTPPLPATAMWYAVLRATHDPGRPLRWIGATGMFLSGLWITLTRLGQKSP